MSKTYSAGIVTAYGAAKRAGYQGTYEDFCRQQAGYAESAATVEQAKTDAINAKNDAVTAKNIAISAKDNAVSAKNTAVSAKYEAVLRASEASDSATSAGQSATNAAASATSAAQSASAASTKASEASASATSAGQSATNAAASATSAAQSANDAQDVLDSILADYSEMSADVEQLKADLADVTNHAVKSAEQLISDKRTVDKVPYKYRASASGKSDRAYDMIVGGTVCFNQLCNSSSVDTVSGRKYLTKIGGIWSIVTSTGSAITGLTSGTDMVMDLTAMFSTTIADHIYSLEQATAGAGVALFRQMFPNEYYPYNAGELVSVEGLSAHIMRDADDNIIGSYLLDSTLTLRGIPKLVDGKIEFDGDTYASDGTVKRRYGIVDLGTLSWNYNSTNKAFITVELNSSIKPTASDNEVPKFIQNKYNQLPRNQVTLGTSDKVICENTTGTIVVSDLSYTDATVFKASLSGVYLVYELATPTTETATPYTSPQIVNPYGTEGYVSTSVCPVGHVTEYPDNLRAKLDGLPWDLSMIAPVETAYKATRNYTTGNLLIVDNTLYKVTSNIANGGTITEGKNVVATTLSEVILALE